ncbi:MAG: ACP S-malonyltransferase [Proteobacteria bacterium]|nr:ACP S-malonyltransferase [Pseudomonadota bacterium]
MKNIAFLFPGQGSQLVGMAKGLYEGSDKVRSIFDEASTVLGHDMKGLIFDGPAEELNLTRNAQAALVVANYSALTALNDVLGLTPVFVAGHSLGEFSALVAAGVLDFADALRLVDLRGKFMQEAVKVGEGSMCAVLGIDTELLGEICSEASTEDEKVVVANINCPGQVVISGHAKAVERASEFSLKQGASRAIVLKVSVPSHSPLMESAAEHFAQVLDKINFKPFNIPVVTNVEAEALTDSTRVAGLLTDQLTSPVRWVESIEHMRDSGVDTMIEVGPGKVLSTLIRRIDKGIKTFRAGEPADIDAIVEAFKG